MAAANHAPCLVRTGGERLRGDGARLDVDSRGIDDHHHRVHVIAEGLSGPTGIVGLEDGTLYVEAFNAGIIHKIHPDGTVDDWLVRAPEFNGINRLTRGPDGTLYVANFRDGGLLAVDLDGNVTEIHKFPRATSRFRRLPL